MTIGEKIKKYRKESNLTQDELAKKINVSHKTISSWEVDRTLPSVDMIYLLSKSLNVSIDSFLDESIKDDYVKETKERNILFVFYIIFLLVVPILYFGFSLHVVGALYLIEFFQNNNLDFSSILNIVNPVVRGIIITYIMYALVQVINYIIYGLKKEKIFIIMTLLELIVAIVILIFRHESLDYIVLVPALSNILLLIIKKLKK